MIRGQSRCRRPPLRPHSEGKHRTFQKMARSSSRPELKKRPADLVDEDNGGTESIIRPNKRSKSISSSGLSVSSRKLKESALVTAAYSDGAEKRGVSVGGKSVTPSPAQHLHPHHASEKRSGTKTALTCALIRAGNDEPHGEEGNWWRIDHTSEAEAGGPPNGVLDLDSNIVLSACTYNERLEASYLSSYGRKYYRSLFDRENLMCKNNARRDVPGLTSKADSAELAKSSSSQPLPSDAIYPQYLCNHNDLAPSMRAILVDWLIELTHSLKLSSETLHLSVSLLDRTLKLCATGNSNGWVVRKKSFQCLGW